MDTREDAGEAFAAHKIGSGFVYLGVGVIPKVPEPSGRSAYWERLRDKIAVIVERQIRR